MGEYLMFVFKFNPKHRIRQWFDNRCDDLNGIFFGQTTYFPPLVTGIRTFFFIDDTEDFFGYILYRPHPVYLVINTQILVKLDQRMRLFAIGPKALQNQIFPIIRPMNERRAA